MNEQQVACWLVARFQPFDRLFLTWDDPPDAQFRSGKSLSGINEAAQQFSLWSARGGKPVLTCGKSTLEL